MIEKNEDIKKRIVGTSPSRSSVSRDTPTEASLADSFALAYRRVDDCLLKASNSREDKHRDKLEFQHSRKNTQATSLDKRTLVLVAGKDAVAFLDGLTTNDIASAVRESRAISTAFLTPQGALEYLCLAFPTDEGVVLECERARLKNFAARLWRARMDCSVSFRWLQELNVASIFPNTFINSFPECETSTKVIALGSGLADGFLFKDPRAPLEAWRLYHKNAAGVAHAVGLPIASLSDYENYRLSLGVVENSEELALPRAFPFEYGLDALATLSWQKACYVGQEITARMKYRARETKKHAFAVRIARSGVAVQRGDKIYSDLANENSQSQVGKLCGEIIYVTSGCGSAGSRAGSDSDTRVGETSADTTAKTTAQTVVLALCNLARLREASQEQGKAVDALSLTIMASSCEKSPAKNLAARLLVPSWLTTLFTRESTSTTSTTPASSSSQSPPASHIDSHIGQESHKQRPRVAGIAVALMLALPFPLPSVLAQDSLQVENLHAQSLKVQKPYRLSVFARAKGARSLAVAEEIASVFISTRGSRLYAFKDGKTHLLADNLNVANGIAWLAPYLYIVEQDKVSRYRFDKFYPRLPKTQEDNNNLLFDQLPNKRHHGWRVATIGPDRKLYIAIGAPCNICSVTGLEGTITRMELDGSAVEVYASGVRNSVGLDFQPSSKTLFFTDNGADFMGDNSPPEEVNQALRKGMFFGYPWFGGGRDLTKKFASHPLPQGNDSAVSFPVATFTAHSAPLGIHFYRGEKFNDLKGDAFVALHGSWNRSSPSGYKVMRLHFSDGSPTPRQSVFIDGFLNMRGGRGRPVDVKTHWDGSLLISDDKRGLVYRIERLEDQQ